MPSSIVYQYPLNVAPSVAQMVNQNMFIADITLVDGTEFLVTHNLNVAGINPRVVITLLGASHQSAEIGVSSFPDGNTVGFTVLSNPATQVPAVARVYIDRMVQPNLSKPSPQVLGFTS